MTNFRVSENMAKKIFTVLPGSKISEAYAYMQQKRVRHLLVVDAAGAVVGVVSDRDFQRAMRSNVETTPSLKIVAEKFNEDDQVQDYMSWDIVSVPQDTFLRDVALKMLNEKISSVVVVDKDEVIGILTTDDMLWTLTRLLEGMDDGGLWEKFKGKIINSPIGALVDTLNQVGI